MTAVAFALLLLVLSVGAVLVIAGQIAEARRAPLTEADRRAAPGQILRLPQGRTHLRCDGPEQGPWVVLVHGLSTPSDVWSPLTGQLVASGCRVLCLDLYGRGLSDAPLLPHRASLYVRQVANLLDSMGIDGPVPLVGFSMGGAVVSAFADAHPERCRGLALLAPGGLRHRPEGLTAFCIRIPGLGDALWSLLQGRALTRWARVEAALGWPDIQRITAREVSRRGRLPAQLSALRHLLSCPMDQVHARIAARRIPVLAVWGARDDIIPISSKDRLVAANPDARQVVLRDAGHGLPYTHPNAVGRALKDWLSTL